MNGTHSGTDPDHSAARSGTETAVGPLTVAEAASLLGVEPRTVIKYRQQGKVRGEKVGKAWRLWLPQAFIDITRTERSGGHSGTVPDHSAARSGTHSEPIEATFTTGADIPPVALVPLAAVADQLQGLADRLADMALEVGQLRERTTSQELTIAELRRRAQVAEAELAGARLRLAAVSVPPVVVVAGQEATEGQDATTTTPAAQQPVQGLWRRLRRAWRGR